MARPLYKGQRVLVWEATNLQRNEFRRQPRDSIMPI